MNATEAKQSFLELAGLKLEAAQLAAKAAALEDALRAWIETTHPWDNTVWTVGKEVEDVGLFGRFEVYALVVSDEIAALDFLVSNDLTDLYAPMTIDEDAVIEHLLANPAAEIPGCKVRRDIMDVVSVYDHLLEEAANGVPNC